jgi:pantothenate synthetase
MEVIETVAALREARSRHTRLGFVPTMGYLHEVTLGSDAKLSNRKGAKNAGIESR